MIARFLSLVLSAALALTLVLSPARSSQNSLQMPTTGTVSGLQFSNDVTDALDALTTCNSGASAPTNASGGVPKAGQCWVDTTSATLLKKYVYSGSDWVLVGVIDVTNATWVPPIGGGTVTIASASTTSICGTSTPQGYLTISGTTSITSFGIGCPAGQTKIIKFAGALTLTYDATALILPAGVNITTAAGDTAILISEGSGNWRVAIYSPASGQAVANPAVPVATKLDYFGAIPPTAYVFGYGQALTRTSYPDYLAAVSITQSATRTSGNATLTSVADTSNMGAGMPIEGTGIPSGTTISSVTSSTIVMSANASTSGTSDATVITSGYGSGGSSSTVGVPDCRGRTIAGRDDMGGNAASRLTSTYFGTSAAALNAAGGAQSHTLTAAESAALTFTSTVTDPGHDHVENRTLGGGAGIGMAQDATVGSSPSAMRTGVSTTGITVATTSNAGGGAHAIVQPTMIANCIIRVLP